MCVCVLGGGWGPHLLPLTSGTTAVSVAHTHGKVAANRSTSGSTIFAKHKTPTALPFLGLQKGPSARILFGNSGRHESRSGGILGPASRAKSEKWRFWKRKKRRNISRPTAGRDIGGPSGRPFVVAAGEAGSFGSRLGALLGAPAGPPHMGRSENGPFWRILGDF